MMYVLGRFLGNGKKKPNMRKVIPISTPKRLSDWKFLSNNLCHNTTTWWVSVLRIQNFRITHYMPLIFTHHHHIIAPSSRNVKPKTSRNASTNSTPRRRIVKQTLRNLPRRLGYLKMNWRIPQNLQNRRRPSRKKVTELAGRSLRLGMREEKSTRTWNAWIGNWNKLMVCWVRARISEWLLQYPAPLPPHILIGPPNPNLLP